MDKPIIRMSASGHCPRAISAQLLGYISSPFPPWLETAAKEGKWHEERLVKELEAEGANIFDRQLEVRMELPNFVILGHIDGKVLATDDTPNLLLEIKSMSQFEFDRWMKGRFSAFPAYAAQISFYMEATGLYNCLYIVKNRSTGYIDRQTLNEKPMLISALKDRITEAVDSALCLRLALADFDPQSIECRRCEFSEHCVPEPKELTPFEKADLESAAQKWRKGQDLIEKGKYIVYAAREVFRQQSLVTQIPKWQVEGLAIQLVHVKETITYPKTKLLNTFTSEQLQPASKVKPAYDQLRITDLAKEENNG